MCVRGRFFCDFDLGDDIRKGESCPHVDGWALITGVGDLNVHMVQGWVAKRKECIFKNVLSPF